MARMRQYSDDGQEILNGYDNEQSAGGYGGEEEGGLIQPEPPDDILRIVDGVGGTVEDPILPDYANARDSQTSRLRQPSSSSGGALGMGRATPARPRTPTPMAGSVSESGGPQMGMGGGVMPFEPLGDMGDEAFASAGGIGAGVMGGPGRRGPSMFGSQGGLLGGGLGEAFDPTPDEATDPIDTLLKKLMGGGGGY
jgi:hypothetical protein